MTIKNFVGHNIKVYREKAGLSQRQLGNMLGVSGSMIGQWETGIRIPKLDTVCKLSNALGVNPMELMKKQCQDSK